MCMNMRIHIRHMKAHVYECLYTQSIYNTHTHTHYSSARASPMMCLRSISSVSSTRTKSVWLFWIRYARERVVWCMFVTSVVCVCRVVCVYVNGFVRVYEI
jgi:hypothetical protein